jgi:ABC-type antimicrobial peptide transport system permease subunit
MKSLNIYQLAQLAVFVVFLIAFVVTGSLAIFDPAAPEAAKGIFSELKLFFAGLLSVNALKVAQNNLNGGMPNEKTDPADPARPDA